MSETKMLSLAELRELNASKIDGPSARTLLRKGDAELRAKRLMQLKKDELLRLCEVGGIKSIPSGWTKARIVVELVQLLSAYKEDIDVPVLTSLHREYAGQVLGHDWIEFGPRHPLFERVVENKSIRMQADGHERGWSTEWIASVITDMERDTEAVAIEFAGLVNPWFDRNVAITEVGKPGMYRFYSDTDATVIQLASSVTGPFLAMLGPVAAGTVSIAKNGSHYPDLKVTATRRMPTVEDGIDCITEMRSLQRERQLASKREVWEVALEEDAASEQPF